MRKIIAITQLSVDGVMQAPGGAEEDPSNGFTHGGWYMHYGDKESGKIVMATFAEEFELILGRRTYEIFAGYWPNHDDNPIGASLNKAKKYVATRSSSVSDASNAATPPSPLSGTSPVPGEDLPPSLPTWNNSRRVSGVDEIKTLKDTEGPNFHIWGSSNLLQSLIAADLVDEHRLWIAPLILGKGKRLFENGGPAHALALVSSVSTPGGIVFNTYRRAGELPGVSDR